MKKMKFFVGAFALVSMVFASCNNEGKNPPVVDPGDDSTEVVLEEAPLLDNPGTGKVTVAVRVPQNTINGLCIIGTMNDWNTTNAIASGKMELVDGTKTWYQITLDYAADASFKFLPILKDKEGKEYITWSVEWTDACVYGSEAWSKDNLKFSADGVVDYFDIKAWSADPSIVFADAGTYKFVYTPVEGDVLPEGTVTFTGNFGDDKQQWESSRRAMTLVDGKYEWEGEVPSFFSFKVFVLDAEGNVQWPNEPDNIVFSSDLVKDGVVAFSKYTFAPTEETPAE